MRRFSGNTAVAVLCTAQFVVVFDVTVVASALPSIRADLGFSLTGVSWVITAYTVALGGLLIAGGRAADLAGPPRIFRAGLAVFAVASGGAALATGPVMLILARVVQGAGAAMLSPAALAALHALITDPDGRRRALGWWTAAAAGGGASGWVLGGVVTELAGWRWVFAVNVPVGLAALALSRHRLPATGLRPLDGPGRTGRGGLRSLDVPGTTLAAGGVALTVLALTRQSWVLILPAAAILAAFVAYERRAAQPMLPPALLRRPGVAGGNLTAAALTGSTTPAMLTALLYVQDTLRLSPARGALLFPAFNLAVVAGSLAGPRLLGRWGARRCLLTGFAGVAAGCLLLLLLPPHGLPIPILPAFALMGAGLGIASVASTSAGTATVAQADRGTAAGLLNSTAQLGTALGLAGITPLIASAAPMTGYRLGFAAASLIALAGAAVTLTVPPGRRSDSSALSFRESSRSLKEG